MNATFILLTSAWLAAGDPGCCDTCSACSKVKPTLGQRLRDWCQSLKNDCCEPACCEAPKPVCCPAPKCDSCDPCCEKKHPLAGLFNRKCGCEPVCCEAPKPVCCPAPACCDSCDNGCGGGLLQRLFSKFHRNDCCDACDSCGSGSSAEPIGAPKEQPKKMPAGEKTEMINPVIIPSPNAVPF